MHINTSFLELVLLADLCNQQGKRRNSHQLAGIEAGEAVCYFFFPRRHCLHSKFKYTQEISWAIRATGASQTISVLGTCLDAGWLHANCQMGMNPGTHLGLSCAWEVFGEPRWHIPKAHQRPLQPFANIGGSCSGA